MRSVLLVVLLAAPAQAQITYLSQTRSVTSYAWMNTEYPPAVDLDTTTIVADGFGPFNETVTSSVDRTHEWATWLERGADATAWQSSVLRANQIIASGGIRGLDSDGQSLYGFGFANASSVFDVTFSVARDAMIDLTVATRDVPSENDWHFYYGRPSVLHRPNYVGEARYSLTGPNTSRSGEEGVVTDTFMIGAGEYHLHVEANGISDRALFCGVDGIQHDCADYDSQPERNFDVSLTVHTPEPATWVLVLIVLLSTNSQLVRSWLRKSSAA